MTTTRHFIGWDRHATEAVCDFLIPTEPTDLVDLSETLIVVPTRQASRRLRESMSSYCATKGSTLLSVQVCVPNAFFRPEQQADYNETNALLTRSIWSNILQNSDSNDFPTLFPATIERNQIWAERSGDALQSLRETLADGGHTIQSVFENNEETLEEAERWHDLALAEQLYLKHVNILGYEDAVLRKIKKSKKPTIPDGIKRIVVASVPDPSLLMISALNILQKTIPIDILILAPEKISSFFDGWGRPIPENWINKLIDIPDAENSVLLAGTAKSQINLAIQSIAKETERFGPSDIAIGVPDRNVIPFLETSLTEMGLNAFDPADKYLKDHPIFGLLDLFISLHTTRRYTDLRNLTRHPDMLAYLQVHNIGSTALLTELDTYQNKYLPTYIEDLERETVERGQWTAEGNDQSLSAKDAMLLLLHPLLNLFDTLTPDEAIRTLLQTIYKNRLLSSKNSSDQAFTAAGEKVTEILREFADCNDTHKGAKPRVSISILLKTLSEQTYHADRDDSQIDLEGWLELPWNNAPFMIVTGMNEGCVPDGHLSDMFLPDSLRHQLKLRNDAARLARDAYLMSLLIETRRAKGKTIFITGKTSTAGDPLKPSRLLFRCSQADLVPRAKKLFATIEERDIHHASTISFKLNPTPRTRYPETTNENKSITHLSVTAFKSYLNCPFRFYLSNVMRMRALDDSKREMDAMDFGSMIHAALQRMGESDIWKNENANTIADFLITEADNFIKHQFSSPPPIPVQIARDSARQRLRQAAHIQVELTRSGWDIIRAESRYEMSINDMSIRGTIDRVDQNRDTGAIRIIDYKTSDREITPLKAHIANQNKTHPEFAQLEIENKNRRWIDLQLPLYLMLLKTDGLSSDSTELAYFNLPKSISQTGIQTWDNWNQSLLTSANTCAKTIIEKIQDRVFWPPIENIKYDNFEKLFSASPAECFEEIRRGEQQGVSGKRGNE